MYVIDPQMFVSASRADQTVQTGADKVFIVKGLRSIKFKSMHVYTSSKQPAMSGGSFTHNNTVAPDEKSVFSLLSLKGKTAIISGAGAGIGLRVAQAFAEAGANVAIWYHSNKTAITRAQEIEATYGVK
ncbi:MAG: hypothetical protein Q9180_004133, partial [Flavoplaca navasiana]